MTSAGIGKVLEGWLTGIESRAGFWQGTHDEVQVYVFSDESHDRIRIMAPVGVLRAPDPELLQVLLQANYDRALDARYALRGLELWAVAVHPLATLASDDLVAYLEQVVKLVQNTGTSFASSDLVFSADTEPGPAGEDDGEDGDDGDEEEQAGEEPGGGDGEDDGEEPERPPGP